MQCLVEGCEGRLIVDDCDDRQEWCDTFYYCNKCDTKHVKRTIYQVQSNLIESETLEKMNENGKS